MNSLFCQEGILSGRNVKSVKPEISARLNYNDKIEKIRKILSC